MSTFTTLQNEHYVLLRQLQDEAKKKYTDQLPTEMAAAVHNDVYSGKVFVTQWYENSTSDRILGLGCNINGDACKLEMNIVPGLFVVTSNIKVLRWVAVLRGYHVEVYPMEYLSNNFALHDLLHDYDKNKTATLVKIVTETVTQASKLYNEFKRDPGNFYKFVSVTHYWDVTKQITFELIVRKYLMKKEFNLPQITYRWFDSNLLIYRIPKPDIPIITFDIETVSTDPNRLPTGEDIDDELFTVSIHHNHTKELYTLVYVPIANRQPKDLECEMLNIDKYPSYPGVHNKIEVFITEKSLLIRTMELLTFKGKLHYLLGYNSIVYDIKFLLIRCGFYRLPLDKFVYNFGYNYGCDQIHLDLCRICIMRYTFKQYTLNYVCTQLLKDTKADVSAVELRYTFHRIRKHARLFSHEERGPWPSLRDTLHYNNYDTLLVSKLLAVTGAIDFIIEYTERCKVPLLSMNSNYNKMQYKVMNECLSVALSKGMFLATFKPMRTTIIAPIVGQRETREGRCSTDVSMEQEEDFVEIEWDMESQLNKEKNNKTKKNKYPGGANFCLGEFEVANVQAYDYRIAYPLIIDRKNISDETSAILPAHLLFMMYERIKNKNEFTTYDYLTHTGITKSETKVLFLQYIRDDMYCGGSEFPFNKDELGKRKTSPVIIIWHGRRGILSEIICAFNNNREMSKTKRKILDGVIDIINDSITNIQALQIERDQLKRQMEEQKKVENDEADTIPSSFAAAYGGGVELNESQNTFDFGGIELNDSNNNFGGEDINEEPNIESNDSNGKFDTNDEFGDFGCEEFSDTETMDEKQESTIKSVGNITINNNPYDLQLVDEIIRVHANGSCTIDQDKLSEMGDDFVLEYLTKKRDQASYERDQHENFYRLQKAISASVYGCLGFLVPSVAALITCLIRSTLLNTCNYLTREHNCQVYYCDTDSIFLTNPKNDDLSQILNDRYPHTEIEMKTLEKCFFVQTKTYYYWSDGIIKYGQNINGPVAWRDMVEYFVNCTYITNISHIRKAFLDFYNFAYERAERDVMYLTEPIKLKQSYATKSPRCEVQAYIREKYPALSGSNKQTVFYYLLQHDYTKTVFRPVIELHQKSINEINLFKFYYNMFKTVYNLINFHVKKRNAPYHVKVSDSQVRLMMFSSFLECYGEKFSTSLPTRRQNNEVLTTPDEAQIYDLNDLMCDNSSDEE